MTNQNTNDNTISDMSSTVPVYNLPPLAQMMELNMEHKEGYFSIGPAVTHIFPFTVQAGEPITISAVLRNVDKQDETIHLWISDYPMRYTLFPIVRYLSPCCVSRTVNHFTLTADDKRSKLYVQPNKTYFINLYNNQNYNNEYGLMIDYYNAPQNTPQYPFY